MTTKARHRLHLSEITSFGVVTDPDNPESSILLAKAKPRTPEQAQDLFCNLMASKMQANPSMSQEDAQREVLENRPTLTEELTKSGTPLPSSGVSGTVGTESSPAGRVLRPADRAQLVAKVRLDRADEQLAAMAKTSEETRRTMNQIREMRGQSPMVKNESGRSSASILAEVDRLANSIQKSAGGTTKVQAKAEVWRAHPELAVEIRKAQARERDQGKELAARIDAIVKSYSLSISATPEHMAKTYSQIRNEVMHTAAGLEIKKLRADAMAGRVASETEIRKSAEYRDAWSILKSWEG